MTLRPGGADRALAGTGMEHLVRTLIGLALGVALFVLGIPSLISLNRHLGLFASFGYEQAVLAMLLVLVTVIAVQLTGLKPPSPPSRKD